MIIIFVKMRRAVRNSPGIYLVEKNVARAFYDKKEETHMYLPDYGKYDRNQMRKMTRTNILNWQILYILFDYHNRNPPENGESQGL